ncbi:hypothetical protein F4677DRAFT_450826 [Hypoxylon crocopeplum]|nr:hypothetical protein F4677DRAFT_450826 [Hypoxylon crocopeplum]
MEGRDEPRLRAFGRGFADFAKWRREWKNKDKLWKVTLALAMEDVGNDPRWQAEMTFKITPDHWSELRGANQWIEFPTVENIKWMWLREPDDGGCGYDGLATKATVHWRPDLSRQAQNMPFSELQGRVTQHARFPHDEPIRCSAEEFNRNFFDP